MYIKPPSHALYKHNYTFICIICVCIKGEMERQKNWAEEDLYYCNYECIGSERYVFVCMLSFALCKHEHRHNLYILVCIKWERRRRELRAGSEIQGREANDIVFAASSN